MLYCCGQRRLQLASSLSGYAARRAKALPAPELVRLGRGSSLGSPLDLGCIGMVHIKPCWQNDLLVA